tara:strand:- start:16422 stop:18218 length:1797 start_codon:yes stop_codon:yes gene_type:complete
MCGFIGALSNQPINHQKLLNVNKRLECRGPDQKVDIKGNLNEFNENLNLNHSLIFNRLSIIDLSDNATQPMFSRQFNTLIMFNGEIYNHRELRTELEKKKVDFNTSHSDTELLLNGLSVEGISFVNKLIGQFAIIFFNFNTGRTFLIRDRIGQKPLFYFLNKETFMFSSNLKSLSELIRNVEIDFQSYSEYLNYGVVPSPKTIYRNIFKLEPGQYIELDLLNNFKEIKNELYWNLEDFKNENEFEEEKFLDLLQSAVSCRREADVDIAALLSGGVDSTSIVKLLNNEDNIVNTFSIGYKDKKYDESKWFDLVNKKYNTNPTVEILNKKDIDKYVMESIYALDEPYSDPSTIPSYVVNNQISKYFKVAITGDGGDELLGGYKRLQQIMNQNKYNSYAINLIFKMYPWFLGSGNRILSKSKNLSENYISYFSDKKLLKNLDLQDHKTLEKKFMNDNPKSIKDFMIFDFKFYLSEMMMVKVDRTSMANSVEARSPFVDHRLIEYIMYSNVDSLIGNPKYILKNILSNDFSGEFLNRSKMGFVFNLESWIYENLDEIEGYIFETDSFNIYKRNSIKKLSINKSRINAQRLWKMYLIQKLLNT